MDSIFQRILKRVHVGRSAGRSGIQDNTLNRQADKIVELSTHGTDEKLKFCGNKYDDSQLQLQIKVPSCNSNQHYSKIKSLEIHHTQLETIPIAVGVYLNLTNLDISHNNISELPWYLIYLKNLLYLNLSDNKIAEIPHFMGNLTTLIELDLKNNEIVRLPTSLLRLKRLLFLDMKGNSGLKSPSLETCLLGKDAIFGALQKRLGRKDLWADCRRYYQDTLNSDVQLLMQICIENILKNDIEFWIYRNIPPKLKKGLQQEKESREYFQIKHCSSCYKYFSNIMFFDNHECKK